MAVMIFVEVMTVVDYGDYDKCDYNKTSCGCYTHTHTHTPRSVVVSTLGSQPRGPGFETRAR